MTILLESPPFSPASTRVGVGGSVLPAVLPTVTRAVPVDDTFGAAVLLPVTTVRQAARIALDRTRRMTLLGSVPVLSGLALPWLFPLHLFLVGLTADHIRHTPDASLSYSDGTAPRVHPGSLVVAVLLGSGWFAVLGGGVLALLRWEGSGPASVALGLVLVVPVVELLGLLEFALLNPEWVALRRIRRQRTDRRTAFILTSLVSSRDGCGAARRLMDLTYPQWQAVDAVVIGYPASRSLVSYYVRMGARRYCAGAGTAAGRPAGRCVTFDCRRPLRAR